MSLVAGLAAAGGVGVARAFLKNPGEVGVAGDFLLEDAGVAGVPAAGEFVTDAGVVGVVGECWLADAGVDFPQAEELVGGDGSFLGVLENFLKGLMGDIVRVVVKLGVLSAVSVGVVEAVGAAGIGSMLVSGLVEGAAKVVVGVVSVTPAVAVRGVVTEALGVTIGVIMVGFIVVLLARDVLLNFCSKILRLEDFAV